jgi:hypothetical protein
LILLDFSLSKRWLPHLSEILKTDFGDLRIKYLGIFKAIYDKALARESGL